MVCRLGSFAENARPDFCVWLAAGRANDDCLGDSDDRGFTDDQETKRSNDQTPLFKMKQ
jgi:hypothetical protein